ncbi:MAG: PAS domain-containing sensor histidine kinase [bacterium]
MRPLLLQRMRGGLWILLVALLLFFAQSLSSYPDRLGPLYAIKAIQLATILWAFWMLGPAASWRRAVAVALVVLAEVCATTVASDVITVDVTSAMLLFSILAMGTAMLLPWGVGPQALVVAGAAVSIAVNVWLLPGTLGANLPPAVAAVLAFVTSLYAAAVLERFRLAEHAAGEALRASESRKSAIVAGSLDCIITMDGEGRIVEFNPAAERVFGYSAAAVLGRSLSDTIIPPQLREAHLRGLVRHLATGEAAVLGRRLELPAMRADGSEFPVELTVTRNDRGGPSLFTGFLRDLTERNLAREAEVSAALVRASREMIGLLDTDIILERLRALTMEFLHCEGSYTLIWQPQEDAFVVRAAPLESPLHGEPLRARTLPREAAATLIARVRREELLRIADGAADAIGAALPHQRGAGSTLLLALGHGEAMVGMHVATRQAAGAGFTAQEQTIGRGLAQIATMALTNARLVEELERADRVKSEFLSTMSHELRTPLNVVLGYAEMLVDPEVPADQRAAFGVRIQGAGRTLLELVEMTLDLGRAEAGHDEVRLTPLRLPGFWRGLGEDCARLPRPPSVSIEWDGCPPEVTLLTDARKFAIIIRNLMGNALKFTETGCVRAEAYCHDGALAVRISDTGIGIDPAHQQLVFELFRQVDGSDSRRYGGAGLGLYIVRRYVEQLGGRIDLASLPAHGSHFTVSLPMQAAPMVGLRRVS